MYETYFSLLPGYSSTSFATSCTKTGVVSIESLTHEGLGKDFILLVVLGILWPFSGGRSKLSQSQGTIGERVAVDVSSVQFLSTPQDPQTRWVLKMIKKGHQHHSIVAM